MNSDKEAGKETKSHELRVSKCTLRGLSDAPVEISGRWLHVGEAQ